MKWCVFLIICLLSLGSCTTELPLPAPSGEQKITLLGELAGDDTVVIRGGQSVAFGSNTGQPEIVKQLALVIKDGSGISAALHERDDIFSPALFTVPFTSSTIIKPGDTYTVNATHPTLKAVSVSVAVPGAFTSRLTSSSVVVYNSDSILQMDVEINDPNASNAMYVIEVVKQAANITGYFTYNGSVYITDNNRTLYDSLKALSIPFTEHFDTSYAGGYTRNTFYSTDPLAENSSGGGQAQQYRRLFLKGKAFGGGTHQTRILMPKWSLYGDFGQLAQTRVYVKSVATDYYEFLKMYENYDPSIGISGNGNPAKLPSNIVGGYGMVGGVYRQHFDMLY